MRYCAPCMHRSLSVQWAWIRIKEEIVGLSFGEWLIILLVVAMVFGTSKLKNIGKDLGSAVKGFKEGLHEGEEPPATTPRVTHQPAQPVDDNTIDIESKLKS